MNQINVQAWALLLVRLALGYTFFLHGAQKVFGWFGGEGLESFIAWIGKYGVSTYVAYLAAFAELLGGILLFTGIYARLGALMVIGVMLGATFIVHWSHGYFLTNGGYEYTLNLILFSLAVLIGGPGKFYWPR